MKKVGLSILLVVLMVLAFASNSFAAGSTADFSNAKYKFEYIGAGAVNLKISGVTIPSDELSNHKFAITTEKVAPTVDDDYNLENIFKTDNGEYKSGNVESYLELNYTDYYIWVYHLDFTKTGSERYTLINDGTKVARLEDKKYSDVFHATFMSDNDTQIILNVPWDNKTQRNMLIKVGEINDLTILNKIKNSDVNGMKELLSYAKSSTSTLYNQKVKSTVKNGMSRNGCEDFIDLGYSKLKDGAYYFLYVQLDDENGKYYPVEGITLSQGKKFETNNKWSMIFLGASDFSWAGLVNPEPTSDPTNTVDTSISNRGLPYTGQGTMVVLAVVSVIACCVLFIKNEDYKGL